MSTHARALLPELPVSLAELMLTDEQVNAVSAIKQVINLLPEQRPNILIRARAGSAKTTMLCLMSYCMPPPQAFHSGPIFLAFNKAIAAELTTKLPSTCTASTFHALGYSMLRRRFNTKTNTDKYRNILVSVVGDIPYEERATCNKILERARNAALTPGNAAEAFESLVDELDILPEELPVCFGPEELKEVMALGMADTVECDFTDMLWLPIMHGLKERPSNFILVDEAQDTNKVQLALLDACSSPQTCLVFVGDDRQAIYGFRGALTDALSRVRAKFAIEDANVIPLSITFRCPQSVVAEAQGIVPDITAKAGAPLGKVFDARCSFHSFPRDSMVVCRNNKPLARVAMLLLRRREQFEVLSDFFPRLKKFVEVRGKGKQNVDQLRMSILMWQDEQLASLPENRHDSIIERVSTLCEIIEGMPADSPIPKLIQTIGQICDSKGGTKIATIHKSKGLEATHVFFLEPALIPSKYAITPEAITQEMNLKYVAITRAKQTLTYWSHWDEEPIDASFWVQDGQRSDIVPF